MGFNFSSKKQKEIKNLKLYLKNSFGFSPKKIELYQQAFTHKSAANDKLIREDNERLEFLGDAVLSTIIAEYLYKKYPLASEGFLTELRSRILNRNQLNKLSRKIGIDVFINSNEQDFNICESLLGNALEAFIGALYLDRGYKLTKKIFIEKIINNYINIDLLASIDSNYKGKILAWSQKVKNKIEYKVTKEILFNKRKQYIVQLFVNGQFIAEGYDYNIKGAEQNAAMLACEKLEL
ncbi:MAG TPA: ribonuclease III [Bacteroidales bacterium]|jgi:ribonuclease-3|nr:ribonuclease III [Bacteroidales bacterium]HOF15760.1 ribonuclease III [Bacteroidales bacterium]HOR81221.1 ribonuclease III [Bacteroidales bacterium]HPJ90488.1 ribonuclease III [Bacteroidales bacterium]